MTWFALFLVITSYKQIERCDSQSLRAHHFGWGWCVAQNTEGNLFSEGPTESETIKSHDWELLLFFTSIHINTSQKSSCIGGKHKQFLNTVQLKYVWSLLKISNVLNFPSIMQKTTLECLVFQEWLLIS